MKINKINGNDIKNAVADLKACGCGCYHFHLYSTEKHLMHICIGWHNLGDGPAEKGYSNWVIAWKIGMETYQNAMTCDFDLDFIMPYDAETGEVYDTCEEIDEGVDYNALAAEMNRIAPKVVAYQIEQETPESEEVAA